MVNHIKEKVHEIIRIKGIWQETASLRTTRERRLPEWQVFYPLFSFESVLFILCVHWCMLVCEVCIHCCIHRSKTHTATVSLKSQPRRTSRNRFFPFLGWMAFLCLLGSLDSVAFLASLTPILLIAFKRNLIYQEAYDLSCLHLLSSYMCLHHYVCFSVKAFLVLCYSFWKPVSLLLDWKCSKNVLCLLEHLLCADTEPGNGDRAITTCQIVV